MLDSHIRVFILRICLCSRSVKERLWNKPLKWPCFSPTMCYITCLSISTYYQNNLLLRFFCSAICPMIVRGRIIFCSLGSSARCEIWGTSWKHHNSFREIPFNIFPSLPLPNHRILGTPLTISKPLTWELSKNKDCSQRISAFKNLAIELFNVMIQEGP